MQVIVQNCVTRLYLGEGKVWHAHGSDAKIFRSGAEAIHYCTEHGVTVGAAV